MGFEQALSQLKGLSFVPFSGPRLVEKRFLMNIPFHIRNSKSLQHQGRETHGRD